MKNSITKEQKIRLLKRIQAGEVCPEELTGNAIIINDFLSLMKAASLSDQELEGRQVVVRGEMKDFFNELKERNNERK